MSSNYATTKTTQAYRDAVVATEQIESPSLGFIRPSEFQGPASRNSTVIKQNNTQLQLLVQIAESLKDIRAELKLLTEQTRKDVQTASSIWRTY